LIGQFTRYVAVGLFLNLALFGTYAALTAVGMAPIPAMSVSYGLGVAAGFIMNRRITFAHNGRPARAFFRYLIAYAIGYLANLVGLWWLVERLAVPHHLAQAGLIVAIACFLFVLQRMWVFAEPRNGLARRAEHIT
jgi:putative flippase GtrA